MATQISIDDCMPDSFLNRVRRFIEPDDRRQICRMGLLYAVRTWRAGMIPFEVYARRCISAILKCEERLYRDANRAEARLSLDMPVGYEPGTKQRMRISSPHTRTITPRLR
jgi:hypothetical protein